MHTPWRVLRLELVLKHTHPWATVGYKTDSHLLAPALPLQVAWNDLLLLRHERAERHLVDIMPVGARKQARSHNTPSRDSVRDNGSQQGMGRWTPILSPIEHRRGASIKVAIGQGSGRDGRSVAGIEETLRRGVQGCAGARYGNNTVV